MSSTQTAKKRVTIAFLLLLTAVCLYFCYVMARPFLKPIFVATVIAIIFYPIHTKIQRRIRRPNAAALVSTILILLIIAVPAVALGRAIVSDLHQLYSSLSQRSAEGGGWTAYFTHLSDKPLAWVGRHVDLSHFDARAEIRARIARASSSLVALAEGFAGNLASFVVDSIITFLTLFFLFREGRSMRQQAAALLPLEPAQVEKLFKGVSDTVVANVHGVLAVGAAQGTLTGLAFWALGLPSPILWGAITALCSLVPMVGSGLVWVPATLVLVASGHWIKGLMMVGWGGGVVAVVDHIVRPYVVSERVKLNTAYVFFALLGGVKAFGVIGLFVGPIILSVTTALFEMLRESEAWDFDSAAVQSAPSLANASPDAAGVAPKSSEP